MADIFCPSCWQRFKSLDELRLHGKQNHKEISPLCKLCNRRFENQTALYTHIISGSKAHCKAHALICRIPQCRPEECIGSPVSLSNAPTALPPNPPSGPSENSAAAVPHTQGTQATASQTLQPSNQPKKKTKPCYLCNKGLTGKNGRKMHMKDSADHRNRHAQLCKKENCDPTVCFGTPQARAKSTTVQASPAMPAGPRAIVEPGPPDPSPSSAQAGPPAASTSNTKTPIQAKKAKTKKRKKATTANAPTRPISSPLYQYTSSDENDWSGDSDWFPQWGEYSMYGRGMLECNYCHAPVSSGGQWDHSCPGDSD